MHPSSIFKVLPSIGCKARSTRKMTTVFRAFIKRHGILIASSCLWQGIRLYEPRLIVWSRKFYKRCMLQKKLCIELPNMYSCWHHVYAPAWVIWLRTFFLGIRQKRVKKRFTSCAAIHDGRFCRQMSWKSLRDLGQSLRAEWYAESRHWLWIGFLCSSRRII